jgi:hypothetical protein
MVRQALCQVVGSGLEGNYGDTSQWPPLAGPMRLSLPEFTSFAAALSTPLADLPIWAATSASDNSGWSVNTASIFSGVFSSGRPAVRATISFENGKLTHNPDDS